MAKQKKCAYSECDEMFTPRNMQHKCHDYICAIEYQAEVTAKRKAKEARRNLKEFNQQDKSWLMKEAQKWFNKYIRERDKDLPCISCGNTDRQMHCGHFKSVGGNGNLRFNEDNCHKQCSICNNHLSGNIGEYTKNLILKIGQERVDALDIKTTKVYTVEELQEIIEKYKSKVKEL